jgi:hypothetical protein
LLNNETGLHAEKRKAIKLPSAIYQRDVVACDLLIDVILRLNRSGIYTRHWEVTKADVVVEVALAELVNCFTLAL